jgi:hypothetical protein
VAGLSPQDTIKLKEAKCLFAEHCRKAYEDKRTLNCVRASALNIFASPRQHAEALLLALSEVKE